MANNSLEDYMRYYSGMYGDNSTGYGRNNYDINKPISIISSLGDRENQLLQQIQQYDPNARWDYIDNSQSSNENGQVAPNTYNLNFDIGKLPRNETGMHGGFGLQYMGNDLRGDNFFQGRLFQPNAVHDSEYGRVTDSRNVDTRDPTDRLWALAPLLVGGVAGLAGGGGLLGLLGQGGNFGSMFTNSLFNLARSGGRNWASTLLGLGGSALGLPSYVTTLGRIGLNLAQNRR